ncbi:hypothetical protein CHUAL_001217 [Chamberlinius hualienensis]
MVKSSPKAEGQKKLKDKKHKKSKKGKSAVIDESKMFEDESAVEEVVESSEVEMENVTLDSANEVAEESVDEAVGSEDEAEGGEENAEESNETINDDDEPEVSKDESEKETEGQCFSTLENAEDDILTLKAEELLEAVRKDHTKEEKLKLAHELYRLITTKNVHAGRNMSITEIQSPQKDNGYVNVNINGSSNTKNSERKRNDDESSKVVPKKKLVSAFDANFRKVWCGFNFKRKSARDKAKHVSKVYDVIKGKLLTLVSNQFYGNVIVTFVKNGNVSVQNGIFDELKDHMNSLMSDQYTKNVVIAFLKNGTAEHRKKIFSDIPMHMLPDKFSAAKYSVS